MDTGDDLCLAPLRGVTVRAFRNLFATWFEPPDRAVAPFIPTFAGEKVKPVLLQDVDPGFGQKIPVVPQVIGKDPAQLRTLLRSFKSLGYTCADLNAGCPWPFVAKKGRGAGLMRDAAAFGRMLEVGCEEMPDGFSVKVRLGMDKPDLLAQRMSIINAFPLREVAIHARTAKQMYEGMVMLEAFEVASLEELHQKLEPFLGGTSEVLIELEGGTAVIPWELLDTDAPAQGGADARPWAIRAKLLRKLRTRDFREGVRAMAARQVPDFEGK